MPQSGVPAVPSSRTSLPQVSGSEASVTRNGLRVVAIVLLPARYCETRRSDFGYLPLRVLIRDTAAVRYDIVIDCRSTDIPLKVDSAEIEALKVLESGGTGTRSYDY